MRVRPFKGYYIGITEDEKCKNNDSIECIYKYIILSFFEVKKN